jgi:hypothetical protein
LKRAILAAQQIFTSAGSCANQESIWISARNPAKAVSFFGINAMATISDYFE